MIGDIGKICCCFCSGSCCCCCFAVVLMLFSSELYSVIISFKTPPMSSGCPVCSRKRRESALHHWPAIVLYICWLNYQRTVEVFSFCSHKRTTNTENRVARVFNYCRHCLLFDQRLAGNVVVSSLHRSRAGLHRFGHKHEMPLLGEITSAMSTVCADDVLKGREREREPGKVSANTCTLEIQLKIKYASSIQGIIWYENYQE